jgi:hypothetical protein
MLKGDLALKIELLFFGEMVQNKGKTLSDFKVHKYLLPVFCLHKPGGRVAISDILAKQPLPEIIRNNPTMLVRCISKTNDVTDQ